MNKFSIFNSAPHEVMNDVLETLMAHSPCTSPDSCYGSNVDLHLMSVAAANGTLSQEIPKLSRQYDTELLSDLDYHITPPVNTLPLVYIDFLIKPKYHHPDTMVLKVDSMGNTNITKLGVNNVKDNSNNTDHIHRDIPFRYNVLYTSFKQCT